MAHFFKAEGMSGTGFDLALTKQSLRGDEVSTIALFGGDSDGPPLTVSSNNPGIIALSEDAPRGSTVRAFRLAAKKPGYTMVEAKNRGGHVWASLQVQVAGGPALSREERVAEAMKRSLVLLPGELREAVEGLFAPESILIVTGTLVLWVGSHLVAVGEIVDVVLLVIGAVLLGKSVFDLAEHLWQFASLSINGTTDGELDQAAKHFASAVTIAGIDVLTAVLLHRNLRDVRLRPPKQRPVTRGLLNVEPPPAVGPGNFYRPKISRPRALPSGALGETSFYGDIYVTRVQSLTEQRLTLFHESVHSFFSPKCKFFLHLRARLKASAYWRSALLRYLEEALAEGYAQFKVRGLADALKAISFPIGPAPYGYVTVSQLIAEGAGIGSIVLGGQQVRVTLASKAPDGMPPFAP